MTITIIVPARAKESKASLGQQYYFCAHALLFKVQIKLARRIAKRSFIYTALFLNCRQKKRHYEILNVTRVECNFFLQSSSGSSKVIIGGRRVGISLLLLVVNAECNYMLKSRTRPN